MKGVHVEWEIKQLTFIISNRVELELVKWHLRIYIITYFFFIRVEYMRPIFVYP